MNCKRSLSIWCVCVHTQKQWNIWSLDIKQRFSSLFLDVNTGMSVSIFWEFMAGIPQKSAPMPLPRNTISNFHLPSLKNCKHWHVETKEMDKKGILTLYRTSRPLELRGCFCCSRRSPFTYSWDPGRAKEDWRNAMLCITNVDILWNH